MVDQQNFSEFYDVKLQYHITNHITNNGMH